MAARDVAGALRRVMSVLLRRPDAGLQEDPSATAYWQGGTRVMCTAANGKRVLTDMPTELGGSGDQVSPGWLLRAGFASCTATCIAMGAAAAGFELTTLEVQARSRSDTRGMLGLAGPGGEPVYPGPRDVEMRVIIAAHGVPEQRLRELVEHHYRVSPMVCALKDAVPVTLQIEVGSG